MKNLTYHLTSIAAVLILSCGSDSPTAPSDGGQPPLLKGVVINEVDLGIPDAIEIYNAGAATENLGGWILKTGDASPFVQRFVMPSIDLEPGEFIVFTEGTGVSTDSTYYLGTSIEGGENINWSSSTPGAIEFINSNNSIIDYVEWGNYTEMDASPLDWSGEIIEIPPRIFTLGRDINSTDTNHSSDIITLIGTMGQVNNSHPIILNTDLGDGLVGSQFEEKIDVAGPAGPFSYEILSGSLPGGLSVDSEGYVRGMITEGGSFTFNLRIMDSQIPPKPALATMSITAFDASLSFSKNILLVNGVHWDTYESEIYNAYAEKAFWGNNEMDFWDVFSVPLGGYPNTVSSPLGHGEVPIDVLGEYSTVIWVGNDYLGDLGAWQDSPVFTYVKYGGNLLLLTRRARNFINNEFRKYLGITWAEQAATNVAIQNCIAVYPGLATMHVEANHTWVDVFDTELTSSESTLLFTETQTFGGVRGLSVWKNPAMGGILRLSGGQVVLIGIRPYRVNPVHLRQNVEVILSTFFNNVTVSKTY